MGDLCDVFVTGRVMEMSWGRLFPEQRRQILPGEAALFLHHLLRLARGDDFAALDPAFGAEVDAPVVGLDDVQVMSDHPEAFARPVTKSEDLRGRQELESTWRSRWTT